MSFLLSLRTAAKQHKNPETRKTLRNLADNISSAIDDLVTGPTADQMRTLNGAWIQAHVYFEGVITPPEDGGGGQAPSSKPTEFELPVAA